VDDVIFDLQQLRDFLHSEGERVQQEISAFLQLNQAAIGSTRVITDNIRNWKEATRSAGHRSDTTPQDITAPPQSLP
jgi:hypothetical protein